MRLIHRTPAAGCAASFPASWLSRTATKEQSVSKPSRECLGTCGRVWLSAARVVSTQPFAGAHVLAQPACGKEGAQSMPYE